MIGNDVIDLTHVRQHRWIRSARGWDKAFTAAEQAFLRAAHEPVAAAWWLWACKESAYKAGLSQQRERTFAPRKIVSQVTIDATATQELIVSWGTQNIRVRTVQRRPDMIHTIATLVAAESAAKGNEVVRYLTFRDTTYATQHQQLRQDVTRYFQHYYQRADLKVSIRKNEWGIPTVYLADDPLPWAFSCSHHGRFGAWVVIQTRDLQ
ncbi:MAG: 4'-phosphopantetheinyl transferase superfamily protein [Bacteroidota bacterium]